MEEHTLKAQLKELVVLSKEEKVQLYYSITNNLLSTCKQTALEQGCEKLEEEFQLVLDSCYRYLFVEWDKYSDDRIIRRFCGNLVILVVQETVRLSERCGLYPVKVWQALDKLFNKLGKKLVSVFHSQKSLETRELISIYWLSYRLFARLSKAKTLSPDILGLLNKTFFLLSFTRAVLRKLYLPAQVDRKLSVAFRRFHFSKLVPLDPRVAEGMWNCIKFLMACKELENTESLCLNKVGEWLPENASDRKFVALDAILLYNQSRTKEKDDEEGTLLLCSYIVEIFCKFPTVFGFHVMKNLSPLMQVCNENTLSLRILPMLDTWITRDKETAMPQVLGLLSLWNATQREVLISHLWSKFYFPSIDSDKDAIRSSVVDMCQLYLQSCKQITTCLETIIDSLCKRWSSPQSFSNSRQSKCTILQCLQVVSYCEIPEMQQQEWTSRIFSHLFEYLKDAKYGNPQVLTSIYNCLSSWLYRHKACADHAKSLLQWVIDTWDSKHKEDQAEWASLLEMLFYIYLSPQSKNWNSVPVDILQTLGVKLCERKKGVFSLKHDNLLCCLILMGTCLAIKEQTGEDNKRFLETVERWLSSCSAAKDWGNYSEELLDTLCELCRFALIDFDVSKHVSDWILHCLCRLILDPSTCHYAVIRRKSICIVQQMIEASKDSNNPKEFHSILDRFFWVCMEYELNSHCKHIDGTFLYWYPSQAWETEGEREAIETLLVATHQNICDLVAKGTPVISFFLFLSTQTARTRTSKWWNRLYRCFTASHLTKNLDAQRIAVEEWKNGLQHEQRSISHCCAQTLASYSLFLPFDVVHHWIWDSLSYLCFSQLENISREDYEIFIDCLPILSQADEEILQLQKELESLQQQLSSLKAPTERKKSQVVSRNKQQTQADLDRQKSMMEKRVRELEERISHVQKAQKTAKILLQAEAGLHYIVGLHAHLSFTKEHLRKHISKVMDWIPILIQYGILRSLVLSAIVVCCKVCEDSIAKEAYRIANAFEECLWKHNELEWIDAFSSEQLSLEAFCIFYPLLERTLEEHPSERNLIRKILETLQKHLENNPSIAVYCASRKEFAKLLYRILEREDSNFSIASSCLGEWSERGFQQLDTGEDISPLLSGLLSGKSSVRGAFLDAIARLPILTLLAQDVNAVVPTQDALLCRFLWLSCHDPEEENALVAQHLFHLYHGKTSLELDVPEYVKWLSHSDQDIRAAAAQSIAHLYQNYSVEEYAQDAKTQWNKQKSQFLAHLFSLYVENLESKDKSSDSLWKTREGVARVLEAMGQRGVLETKELPVVFTFFIARGFGDVHDQVRARNISAAIALINSQGANCVSTLLSLVERQLSKDTAANQQSNDKEQLRAQDLIKEGLVVSLGTLAQHLNKDDPRIETSMEWLIKICLETPSEPVQVRVRDCLQSLAPMARSKSLENGTRLSKELVTNDSYGARRGAAYALTGIVKGIGLGSLSEMGILESLFCRLEQQKLDVKAKQGRLFLLEILSKSLKGIIDPYVMETLPFLLSCSGDSSAEVRETFLVTSKALMSSISGICVRIVLPQLLKGLQDRSWRVKVASCEMLGTMAYCAPRQLAECLPQIVPKLSDALIDSHPKVVETAEASLYRIASVTKNPEVRDLAPFIMEALRNPAMKTSAALDAMMATEFTHIVDAASISLLIPVLHRGLRERSTEVKKKAALILGSMCSQIASPKDMEPYLEFLLPSIFSVLLDPIPDARAAAARALGYFARGVGTANIGGLLQKLVEMVQNGKSSAERLGAAMGLAEVSTAANAEELEWIVTESMKPYKVYLELQEMNKKKSGITVSQREGTFLVMATLSLTLGNAFEKYIPVILPIVLEGFGDESDIVREAALHAGHHIVSVFSTCSFQMLIPLLVNGLKHNNWRMRQASVQLLGTLLFSILGYENTQKTQLMGSFGAKSNDNDGEEDVSAEEEEESSYLSEEQKTQALQERADNASFMTWQREKQQMEKLDKVLGYERRCKILTLLFISNRGDVNSNVRSRASAIWKALVANTPKNIRELLPLIIEELVEELSSHAQDLHERACDTLTDLIQRLGDRFLPELLPLLEKSFDSSSSVTRQSVSDGLLQIVQSCSKQLLLNNMKPLLKLTLWILKDGERNIRRNGAVIFAHLFRVTGDTSLQYIYPSLLQLVRDSTTQELGLNALEEVIEVGSSRVVQWIVANLIDSPYLAERGVGQVFACAIQHSQSSIPTLTVMKIADKLIQICEATEMLRDDKGDHSKTECESSLLCIIEAMTHSSSYISTVAEKWRLILEKEPKKKAFVLYLMGLLGTVFFPSEDSQDTLFSSLLTTVIQHLDSRDERILHCSIQALDRMLQMDSQERKKQLIRFLSVIRKALMPMTVRSLDKITHLRGISTPYSPAALMNVCLEGLNHGDVSIKKEAVTLIQLTVKYSDSKALSPIIVKVVGVLIRLSSDRHASSIKAAIMRSFYQVLQKGCMEVRVFVPQLQSVLLKSLSDSQNASTRHFAAKSLGLLVKTFSSIRWDALWSELFHLLDNDKPLEIRLAGLCAIRSVFDQGPNEKLASWDMVESNLLPYLYNSSEKQFIWSLSEVLGTWAQSIQVREPVWVFKLLASLLSTSSTTEDNILPLTAGLAISEIFKALAKTENSIELPNQSKAAPISSISELTKLMQCLVQSFQSGLQSQRVLCSRICVLYLDFLFHLQVQKGYDIQEHETKCWQMITKLQKDTSEQVRSEVIATVRWIKNKSLLERMVPWVVETMKTSTSSNEQYAAEQTLRKLYQKGTLLTLSLGEGENSWITSNMARLQLAVGESSSEEEFEFGED